MSLNRSTAFLALLIVAFGIRLPAHAEEAPESSAPAESILHSESANITVAVEETGPSPRELFVKPGATVAWVNHSKSPVVIRFLSQAVSTTCKAPRRFAVGPAGIYVSETLAPSAVASLCFLEREEYPYRIEFLRGDEETTSTDGMVVVEP